MTPCVFTLIRRPWYFLGRVKHALEFLFVLKIYTKINGSKIDFFNFPWDLARGSLSLNSFLRLHFHFFSCSALDSVFDRHIFSIIFQLHMRIGLHGAYFFA